MTELYFSPARPDKGRLAIDGTEARHICRVMRHRRGDRIAVTDGAGCEYGLELESVGVDRVIGRVVETGVMQREPGHRLVLAQAVLKGDKLEQVCEQATELGIRALIPLRTERTIGRLAERKHERLHSAALAGMKSSTRTVLPEIEAEHDLAALARRAGEFDQVLVAYEDERGVGLADVIHRDARSVLVVVGPEGGFAAEEVETLKRSGAMSFSLGPRRLRAETAAVATVAAVLQMLGDLG